MLDGIRPDFWVAHLVAHLPIARAGTDAEGAHQLRVAVARLQVWLELAGRRALRDDLKWLRDRVALVRDLDVHLKHDPPPELGRQLRLMRHAAQDELVRTLDQARLGGIVRALAHLPAITVGEAQPRLRRLAHTALRRHQRALEHPHSLRAMHRLRRALRDVRFALEWLGHPAGRLADAQDAFGAVADRVVALRHLDTVQSHDGELDNYRRRLHHELSQKTRAAKRVWHKLIPELQEIAQ